jgi:hypothetical protein
MIPESIHALIRTGERPRSALEDPTAQISVRTVLSRSRAEHRGGRLYARQASPEDVALSMRRADNEMQQTRSAIARCRGPRC